MKHTFLFEPGRWTAAGTFWSGDGRAMPAEGRSDVSHGQECWMIAGRLRVLSSPPVEFLNIYCMQPPTKDMATSGWSMENSSIGKLQGTFTVIDATILGSYRCDKTGYAGTEALVWLDDDRYDAYGVLLQNDKRMCSWRVALTREHGG